MSNWSEGYMTDIAYTYGYYQELNPMRVRMAMIAAGLNPPEFSTACELGFGQGMSINVHAAASTVEWFGTDFNPSQAAFARRLAGASQSRAHLFDEAFQEFCRRDDLPDFDYIGLHGIFSWISPQNRTVIVDFLRRKLKVGGVLYISYNTLPGWSAFAPLRHLMSEHGNTFGSAGRGVLANVGESLEFTEKFLAAKPAWLKTVPHAAERFNAIKTQNRSYLAHEYFNADWSPMYFSDMARWLAPAKLSFACSAHMLDHVDGINFTAEQRQMVSGINDPVYRETLRDFIVNQQFRRDFWVKGPERLTGPELGERLGDMRVVLLSHRPDIQLKVTGPLGEAGLSGDVYDPILDILADHKPRSLAELDKMLKPKNLTTGQLREAVIVLAGAGHLAMVQDDADISKAKKTSQALNAYITTRARGGGDIQVLSSPVTGGGFPVNRFQQLFLAAHKDGRKTPSDWADYAWAILRGQGQKIIKDGAAIETDEGNRAEMGTQADAFAAKFMPILKALQIV